MTETASILAVGSELLGTTRLDTNSLFLTGELEAIGVRVVRKACVVDGWDELLAELRFALERSPLLGDDRGFQRCRQNEGEHQTARDGAALPAHQCQQDEGNGERRRRGQQQGRQERIEGEREVHGRSFSGRAVR